MDLYTNRPTGAAGESIPEYEVRMPRGGKG